ncbi:PE-PGRS family protein [Phenylobacterium zucineum HLK1]|uniref:PE-PGRS family protein n=1 Tax=Phenylobacterium zucineum (strain HLK1) TaxID=450851 RepID=B4R7W7_PHEZH|nr:PE-PGRS family protein [Phenylobacterium zucineum HLK1]
MPPANGARASFALLLGERGFRLQPGQPGLGQGGFGRGAGEFGLQGVELTRRVGRLRLDQVGLLVEDVDLELKLGQSFGALRLEVVGGLRPAGVLVGLDLAGGVAGRRGPRRARRPGLLVAEAVERAVVPQDQRQFGGFQHLVPEGQEPQLPQLRGRDGLSGMDRLGARRAVSGRAAAELEPGLGLRSDEDAGIGAVVAGQPAHGPGRPDDRGGRVRPALLGAPAAEALLLDLDAFARALEPALRAGDAGGRGVHAHELGRDAAEGGQALGGGGVRARALRPGPGIVHDGPGRGEVGLEDGVRLHGLGLIRMGLQPCREPAGPQDGDRLRLEQVLELFAAAVGEGHPPGERRVEGLGPLRPVRRRQAGEQVGAGLLGLVQVALGVVHRLDGGVQLVDMGARRPALACDGRVPGDVRRRDLERRGLRLLLLGVGLERRELEGRVGLARHHGHALGVGRQIRERRRGRKRLGTAGDTERGQVQRRRAGAHGGDGDPELDRLLQDVGRLVGGGRIDRLQGPVRVGLEGEGGGREGRAERGVVDGVRLAADVGFLHLGRDADVHRAGGQLKRPPAPDRDRHGARAAFQRPLQRDVVLEHRQAVRDAGQRRRRGGAIPHRCGRKAGRAAGQQGRRRRHQRAAHNHAHPPGYRRYRDSSALSCEAA